MRIRGGSGLGDSIYLRPICDHYAERGPVTALSDYPDVFLGSAAKVEKFSRQAEVVAHYVQGKRNTKTTQWEDVQQSAGLNGIPLSMPWAVRNVALIERIRLAAGNRKVVLVHGGREPMGRKDQYARELLPRSDAFAHLLAGLDECFLVGVGKEAPIYSLPVSVDLTGETSVSDLLDLAYACDAVVGQVSFAIPLAEVFDKPLLVLWSARCFASEEILIRTITPQKLLTKKTSWYAVDDSEFVTEEARGFAEGLR